MWLNERASSPISSLAPTLARIPKPPLAPTVRATSTKVTMGSMSIRFRTPRSTSDPNPSASSTTESASPYCAMRLKNEGKVAPSSSDPTLWPREITGWTGRASTGRDGKGRVAGRRPNGARVVVRAGKFREQLAGGVVDARLLHLRQIVQGRQDLGRGVLVVELQCRGQVEGEEARPLRQLLLLAPVERPLLVAATADDGQPPGGGAREEDGEQKLAAERADDGRCGYHRDSSRLDLRASFDFGFAPLGMRNFLWA